MWSAVRRHLVAGGRGWRGWGKLVRDKPYAFGTTFVTMMVVMLAGEMARVVLLGAACVLVLALCFSPARSTPASRKSLRSVDCRYGCVPTHT